MADLKQQVYELFRFCEELYGIDIESKLSEAKNYRSGTIERLSDENDLFTIYNNITSDNLEIAYTQCFNMVSWHLEHKILVKNDLSNTLKSAMAKYQKALPLVELYEKWNVIQRQEFKKYLFANNWLKEEEKTEDLLNKFDWMWVSRAKNALNKGYIKTYSTTSTEHQSELTNLPYTLPDVLIITSDPINIYPNSKANDQDKVIITMYMKIEEIIDYSYFIFTFQHKGELYIATDKMNFSNPRVANCSRNPRQRRKDTFDNVDLPYGIIDDIINWRKENTQLTKNPGQEVYIKQISDYLPVGSRVSIRLLLEELLYSIIPFSGELPKIGYVSEQKLIGDGSETNPFSKINYEECKRFYYEYVLPESTTITIAPKNELLLKHVSPSWLATPQEITNLAIWAEKEESRKQKQELFNIDDLTFARHKDQFNVLIKENLDKLLEVALSGNTVYTYIVDVPPVENFGDREPKIPINQFCAALFFKEIWTNSVIHSHTGTDYKPHYRMHTCALCNHTTATGKIRIDLTTYKQLVAILGIGRKELPFAFQNYNAYIHRPYVGNSILDNINPEFLITDKMSKDYPNRYTIGIECDKNCFNKLVNKYRRFDNALVLLSYNNRCIIDIVDYDEFKKENPHINSVTQGFI